MSGQPSPLRPALREHILAGKTVKEFAFAHSVELSTVGKMLSAEGIRKYFLTTGEWQDVLSRRRQAQGGGK